jgi:hypothetical protein
VHIVSLVYFFDAVLTPLNSSYGDRNNLSNRFFSPSDIGLRITVRAAPINKRRSAAPCGNWAAAYLQRCARVISG